MPRLRAGVIGYPVSHSISPQIFGFISKRTQILVNYEKIEIHPTELKAFVEHQRQTSSLEGWNITLPHKQTIIPWLDRVSPEVKALGAVNVVKRENSSGEYVGFNTDFQGVLDTFERNQIVVEGRNIVLIGAGGAARSVAYALGLKKARSVWIKNRSIPSAQQMAQAFNSIFPETSFQIPGEEKLEEVSLYVNCTPLGMSGYGGCPEIPTPIEKDSVALDLIYRPKLTPFLEKMSQRGVRGVGGLDMLIGQALAAWKIWTGNDISHLAAELKDMMEKELVQ